MILKKDLNNGNKSKNRNNTKDNKIKKEKDNIDNI